MWLKIRHGSGEDREGGFERTGFQSIGESAQGALHTGVLQLRFILGFSAVF